MQNYSLCLLDYVDIQIKQPIVFILQQEDSWFACAIFFYSLGDSGSGRPIE